MQVATSQADLARIIMGSGWSTSEESYDLTEETNSTIRARHEVTVTHVSGIIVESKCERLYLDETSSAEAAKKIARLVMNTDMLSIVMSAAMLLGKLYEIGAIEESMRIKNPELLCDRVDYLCGGLSFDDILCDVSARVGLMLHADIQSDVAAQIKQDSFKLVWGYGDNDHECPVGWTTVSLEINSMPFRVMETEETSDALAKILMLSIARMKGVQEMIY